MTGSPGCSLRPGEREKPCASCHRYGRCSPDKTRTDFYARTRRPDGSVTGYQSRCKDCRRVQTREYAQAHRDEYNARSRRGYQRRVQDPEYAAELRRQNLEAKHRQKERDPEGFAAAARVATRKYAASRMTDPSYRAKRAAARRAERLRLKAEDPEGYAALLAQERRAREERLKDPEKREKERKTRRRYAEKRRRDPVTRERDREIQRRYRERMSPEMRVTVLENHRINETLKRRAQGAKPSPRRHQAVDGERPRMLRSAPLARLLRRWKLDVEYGLLAEEVGTDVRSLYAILSGERDWIRFDLADRIVTRLNLCVMEDLWPEVESGVSLLAPA